VSASRGATPEELRFEAIHLIQESAETRRDFTGRIRVGIVVGVGVPAIRWDLPDPAAPLVQQLPELLGVVGTARNSTPDTDDGQGFVPLLFDGVGPCLQFFDFEQGPLQW
jgi:hypothetical protein